MHARLKSVLLPHTSTCTNKCTETAAVRFGLKSCCSRPRACKFIYGSILAALGLMVLLRIFSAATFHFSKATFCNTRVNLGVEWNVLSRIALIWTWCWRGSTSAQKFVGKLLKVHKMNLYNYIMHLMQLFRLQWKYILWAFLHEIIYIHFILQSKWLFIVVR